MLVWFLMFLVVLYKLSLTAGYVRGDLEVSSRSVVAYRCLGLILNDSPHLITGDEKNASFLFVIG